MKKVSPSNLSVEIDLEQLEKLLVETIAEHSNDRELIRKSRAYCGLAVKYKAQNFKADEYEINEIITVLDVFINGTPSLPSSIVWNIHSFIGLLKAVKHRYAEATQSFLKALWIEKSNIQTPEIYVALTTHRLALMYGYQGEYQKAISLLEKVISSYKKLGVRENKSILQNSKQNLVAFKMYRLSNTCVCNGQDVISHGNQRGKSEIRGKSQGRFARSA